MCHKDVIALWLEIGLAKNIMLVLYFHFKTIFLLRNDRSNRVES